jgi:hypothetical protein
VDFNTCDATNEEDAFAVCSTQELVVLGLVCDSDLNELSTPWDDENEPMVQAA